MKAILIYWHKAKIQGRYIVELQIHSVESVRRYPQGVKYGLICRDLETGRQVLMDNHHPKGPHIHLDGKEFAYEFRGQTELIQDFVRLVLEHLEVKL